MPAAVVRPQHRAAPAGGALGPVQQRLQARTVLHRCQVELMAMSSAPAIVTGAAVGAFLPDPVVAADALVVRPALGVAPAVRVVAAVHVPQQPLAPAARPTRRGWRCRCNKPREWPVRKSAPIRGRNRGKCAVGNGTEASGLGVIIGMCRTSAVASHELPSERRQIRIIVFKSKPRQV